MMKRLIAWLLLGILALSLLPAASAEEISYTGTVKESSLHLRKTPSATGKVINSYKKGTKVDVLENDGTWCKVQIGKRTGYMMSAHLDIQANYPHIGWGKTKDDGTVLNLRKEAKASSDVVFKAMSGGTYELISESGKWYRVRAGKVFGYLEKSAVTPIQGNFTLGFSSQADRDSVTVTQLRTAAREIGNPMTRSQEKGDFTYEISYPDLGNEAADQKITQWIDGLQTLFEKDLKKNHAGSKGHLTVEYQAVKIGTQYENVTLMGLYTVGDFSTETFLVLNIDAKSGKILTPEKLFGKNRSWALFCLESGISSLMTTPTDGYTGKPEQDWLKYAAMTSYGVEVYLPAGLYVPASLGSRKVLLTYYQLADCLGLSDSFLAAYKRVIDPSKPMLALTFDDGPSEETDKIVKVLAQYNARATFCVIGNKVESFAAVLKRTLAGGNEIACHTWSHPKLTTKSLGVIKSQIVKTNEAVKEVAGYTIKVLRPPYGAINKNVRSACKENDMIIATWNIDTLDWKNRNTNKTYRAVIKGAKNGNIILMHDLYSTTAAAAEKAIPELIEKGFQLVTVSELMSFHKDGIKPGNVYTGLDPKNMK